MSFRLEEAISRPYLLTVELSSTDLSVDFGTLLDQPALLTIRRGDTDVRYVHGIVTAFEQGKTGFRRTFYRAVVEPRLAGARLRSDWKIFQQENAPAILQTVLKRSGTLAKSSKLVMDRPMPRSPRLVRFFTCSELGMIPLSSSRASGSSVPASTFNSDTLPATLPLATSVT
ncbi:contractile injection system protein, VgrG/Pvc8 family [Paraburkholderia tropica]|uniref:contractile injection system protein, VgrG/Pvc8 family n=1 Tax=Paraburkholderia tropica TaxID=92647 RepID=UPI002AB7F2B5|nr:contractile injection system protein, VgrG/Pvc8 family [Paraburkholderia tropica]